MAKREDTQAEQAVKRLSYELRQLIAQGEYRTGEWLKQIDIEQRFEVNRFIVRSSFRELTSAGFLEHVPYRGHRVKSHSREERIELSEARALIESSAAVLVMKTIDEAGLVELEALAKQFEGALKQGDRATMVEHNFAFHRLFYSYCNNGYISRLVDDMRERGITGGSDGWRTRQLQEQSCQDHFDMVNALRNQQLEKLQQSIWLHLNRWQED